MSEAKDPRGDDHIEDLLSQLQGIFGKLSHSEEEESQTKIDPPKASVPTEPVETLAPQTSPPEPLSSATPVPPPVQVAATDPYGQPLHPEGVVGAPELPPEIPAPAQIIGSDLSGQLLHPESVRAPGQAAAEETLPLPVMETSAPASEPVSLPVETDKSAVYSIIFYPPNRDSEAKLLTEKVETMAPRFTKIAFQIKVAACIPIDSKGDPQETILSQVKEGVRAVFVIVERPLEEARRKTLVASLEPRGIYVQEVPILSIEKRAFYTDLLLGMVFFYDSLRSGAE